MTSLSKVSQHFPILIILALALILRLVGVNHGLPYLYGFDEPIFVDKARHMMAAKELNPQWFGAPASTLIYLLILIYGLIFIAGLGLGIFKGPADFGDLYYSDPSLFYLSGRLLCVFFSMLIVWLTYVIGLKVFKSKSLALFSALLITLCPIVIENSKEVRMDVIMTFLLLAALWFCLYISEKDSQENLREYCIASFLLGLAIATKYPSVIFSVTIVATYLASKSWRQGGLKKIIFSTFSCVLGCFIGSPFLFINFGQVLRDVAFESRSQHLNATGQGLLSNIFWYIDTVTSSNFSYFAIPFLFIGIIACVLSRNPKKIILTTFPIVFVLFISSLSLRWDRWLIPALPFFSLLISYGISKFASRLSQIFAYKKSSFISIVCISCLLIPMLYTSAIHAKELINPDTRTEARTWILENLPKNSSLLMEVYTPQLPKDDFQYFWAQKDGISKFDANASKDQTFRVRWSVVGEIDMADIQQEEIDYVVLSDMYQKYVKEKDIYPEVIGNYEDIFQSGELIYENQSSKGQNRGPKIQIYKM